MGFFDKVSDFASNFDPTTTEGLLNIGTGGLYGVGQEAYNAASEGLADFDDYVRNEDAMDEAADAAEEAQAMQQQYIDLAREQLELYRPYQQSYLESGDQARQELLAFQDPQEQARIANEAITGDYGQSVLGAAADQLVSQGTALGNRLSSGIQRDVLGQQGALAQQIGQQAIGQREAQLGNTLARMQAGAAGTASPIQQSIGGIGSGLTNIASIGTQQAALNAQNSGINPYLNLIGSTAPLLGGLFGGGGGGTV
jgi:hypothetical protein